MEREWRQYEVTPHCPECHIPTAVTLTQDSGMQLEEDKGPSRAAYMQKEGRTENKAGILVGRGRPPGRQQRAPAERESGQWGAKLRPSRMGRNFRKPFA